MSKFKAPYGWPEDGWEQIGPKHMIRRARDTEGHLHVIDCHQKADGTWCGGSISTNPADEKHWDLISEQPLHVEPSLACMNCPSHGFIRGGIWVDA